MGQALLYVSGLVAGASVTITIHNVRRILGYRRDGKRDQHHAAGGAGAGETPGPGVTFNACSVSGGGADPGVTTEEAPVVDVPISIDPFVGWRTWRVTIDGSLTSRFSGDRHPTWRPRQRFEAYCGANRHNGRTYAGELAPPPAPVHNAPVLECSCGIYAASTIIGAYPVADDAASVFGRVYLWGRTILGANGARGQYAYPKDLFLVPPGSGPGSANEEYWERVAWRVAINYGVPCTMIGHEDWIDWRTVLGAHDLTNQAGG